MKTGDYQRFNENCGIAKIYNKETNQEWFVVYATTWENEPFMGQVIAKGKTKEEALINAIINFTRKAKCFEDAMSDENGLLEKLSKFISDQMLTNDDEVILPIQDYYEIDGEIREVPNRFYNTDILIYEGKAVEAIH